MRYRLGLLNLSSARRPLNPLAGFTRDTLFELGEESFRRGTAGDIYPEMRRLVEELRQNGEEVILASTSFHFLLAPLARELGATGLVCSELEYQDGVATGQIGGEPCYAEEKARRTARYFDSRGLDLSAASFYSDSHHDRPLLDAVAAPVAVNPDWRLKRHARKHGWKLLQLE